MSEVFQPRPVKMNSPLLFRMRCLFDLQLSTIFEQLRIEVPRLSGGSLMSARVSHPGVSF